MPLAIIINDVVLLPIKACSAGKNPAHAHYWNYKMNTKADIAEYLEPLDDDEVVVFAVIHKNDKKYLRRAIDYNTCVCLEHPMIFLQAVAGGLAGDPKNLRNTIFLTNE